jgi:hypothetical protein
MDEHYKLIEKLISLIEKIKEKITDEADMLWTSYETAGVLRTELENYISVLKAGKTDCMDNLNVHFLPASTFQEHSLMNSWADEYIKLSNEFDLIYATIKNKKN